MHFGAASAGLLSTSLLVVGHQHTPNVQTVIYPANKGPMICLGHG